MFWSLVSAWAFLDPLPSTPRFSGVFTGLSVVGAALSIEYGGQVVGVEDPRYVKYWNSIGSKFAFEVCLERRWPEAAPYATSQMCSSTFQSGLAKSIVIQANGLVDEYLGTPNAVQLTKA